MKTITKNARTVFLIILSILSILISFAFGMIYQEINRNDNIIFLTSIGFFSSRQIQRLESPNRTDVATLHKINGSGDLNFIVKLNGVQIYRSPDYGAFTDHQYRETLLWDKTGEVLVLELMGKRVFAFNVKDNKILQKGELSRYILSPLPSDGNFYSPLKDIDE